jgi:hypothetical protein
MRRPDEMHDRISPVHGRCECRRVERIADDGRRTGGNSTD